MSNHPTAVRTGLVNRDFCMVDFGLSKSLIVPADSDMASEHVWKKADWLKPLHYTGPACLRKERKKADFRGTSMYASLRVHQERDYCPRDDIWSLLYVFCDLVSGGLPWMSHAANRDRTMCQTLKERVHADVNDTMEDMLKGDVYHVSAFRRDRKEAAAAANTTGGNSETVASLPSLPEPLKMSTDKVKVDLLRKAFGHLKKLQFWDEPDYSLIQECIWGFALDTGVPPDIPVRPIAWEQRPGSPDWKRPTTGVPEWLLEDPEDKDPLEEKIFDQVEEQGTNNGKDDFLCRLPIQLRFAIAQMEQNSLKPLDEVPREQALQSWLRVVHELLYKDWNAKSFEDGGHRTSTDGFRRDRYFQLLRKCEQCAKDFDYFQSRECYYSFTTNSSDNDGVTVANDKAKKRKITVHSSGQARQGNLEFVSLSRALVGLQAAIQAEQARKPAPPVRISFS